MLIVSHSCRIKILAAGWMCAAISFAQAQTPPTPQQAVSTVTDFVTAQQTTAGGDDAFLKRNAALFTRDLATRWLAPSHVESPDNFLAVGSALHGVASEGFRLQSLRQASDMCISVCAIEVTVVADTPEAPTPTTQLKSLVFLRVEGLRWKIDDVLLSGSRLLKSALLDQ